MFRNKNVVITGSNRGIGYSILEIFSKNKANIWACSRKKDPSFLDQIKKLSNENEIKIKCFNCTGTFDLNSGALQRCHIISGSKGGEDAPSNLIPLCKHCHGISPENDKEAMWNFLKRVGGKNYWPQKALDLYTLAAEQGYAEAQYNLANMYLEGKGTEINYKKALDLYTLAAEQGIVEAQNNLAYMYFFCLSSGGLSLGHGPHLGWIRLFPFSLVHRGCHPRT